MRALVLVSVWVVVAGCQPSARRIVHGPSAPRYPVCTVTMPAPRITDVQCQGEFPREALWSTALAKAAETGPDHASFSFNVAETNEARAWRALRARFVAANEADGQYVIDRILTPEQIEVARVRATRNACQRATIVEGTDPAMRASCLQFLTSQQELAQKERHHSTEVGVQRQAVEAQRQQAVAQQQAADALTLQTLQRSGAVVVGGNACRSSLDCGFGAFCKGWRGLTVCMGRGGAGAPCSSGIDCAGGLFCRGDVCG